MKGQNYFPIFFELAKIFTTNRKLSPSCNVESKLFVHNIQYCGKACIFTVKYTESQTFHGGYITGKAWDSFWLVNFPVLYDEKMCLKGL